MRLTSHSTLSRRHARWCTPSREKTSPPSCRHSVPPAVSSASIIIVTSGCSTPNGKSVMDELLRKGILLFNNCDFFQCHEVLEEAWTKEVGPRRLFLQALIHLPVGFRYC